MTYVDVVRVLLKVKKRNNERKVFPHSKRGNRRGKLLYHFNQRDDDIWSTCVIKKCLWSITLPTCISQPLIKVNTFKVHTNAMLKYKLELGKFMHIWWKWIIYGRWEGKYCTYPNVTEGKMHISLLKLVCLHRGIEEGWANVKTKDVALGMDKPVGWGGASKWAEQGHAITIVRKVGHLSFEVDNSCFYSLYCYWLHWFNHKPLDWQSLFFSALWLFE